MYKKYLLIVLIITVSILAGCGSPSFNENNSEITNEQESIDLSHLIIPKELEVMTPELTKMNIELVERWKIIMVEFNHGENLSDSENEEYEEQIRIYSEELEAFREKILTVDNREIIEDIFDKIKRSEAVYDHDNRGADIMQEGEYYSVDVLYSDSQNEGQYFNDGYILGMGMFEDNTLFLNGVDERTQVPTVVTIKMEFDYEWFGNQIIQ